MAFKFHELSSLVQNDPEKAFKKLKTAFRRNRGSVAATARDLNVDRTTLFRWVKRLKKHGDPRVGQRGVSGRRKAKKKPAKKR